jgi:hypothetical protein
MPSKKSRARGAGKAGDFLGQDPPVRGQNYVCLSFVSPEDVMASKQSMAVGRFLADFMRTTREAVEGVAADCGDATIAARLRGALSALEGEGGRAAAAFDRFVVERGEELTREYTALHGPATSVRGIKVRGSFDTVDEAQAWARKLAKSDPAFSIYVAQVGCWCPWSPNPDDISDSVYANETLNDLMKKYSENQEQLKEYHERLKEQNTGKRADPPAMGATVAEDVPGA